MHTVLLIAQALPFIWYLPNESNQIMDLLRCFDNNYLTLLVIVEHLCQIVHWKPHHCHWWAMQIPCWYLWFVFPLNVISKFQLCWSLGHYMNLVFQTFIYKLAMDQRCIHFNYKYMYLCRKWHGHIFQVLNPFDFCLCVLQIYVVPIVNGGQFIHFNLSKCCIIFAVSLVSTKCWHFNWFQDVSFWISEKHALHLGMPVGRFYQNITINYTIL